VSKEKAAMRDKTVMRAIYRSMQRARQLEAALIAALTAGKPAHVGHPGAGQEAVAAGACAALRNDDHLYCAHRAKHWAIAKGSPVEGIASEMWGQVDGLANGLGGEMHMRDDNVGFIGSSHIVGGSLPPAVGSAMAAKLDGGDRVAVVAFGDGASVQGTFHESLNLAAILELPVLFLCENNQYAESTSVEYFSRPVEIYRKAEPYGIASVRVDGQDALAVFDAVSSAVEAMRADRRPRFVEALTYRYLGHFYGDKTSRYRTSEEELIWTERDPLVIFEAKAPGAGLDQPSMRAIQDEVAEEIARAMGLAEAATYPPLEELSASPLADPMSAGGWDR
jgi:TPP-dependent pyruvate/acetoin dehydrogenase alpha subunit